MKAKKRKSLRKVAPLKGAHSSNLSGTFDSEEEIPKENDFLELVNSALIDKPRKVFESKPTSSESNPFKTKMLLDEVIQRCRPIMATDTMAIVDGLIYKMSAPYRHMKFWRSSRHAFKELVRANALDIVDQLRLISEKIAAANFQYELTEATLRYLGAMLVARVQRLCRTCKLTVIAASHCIAHIELGHLIATNMLLLSVLSDVYSESMTRLKILLDCYDVFTPLISDSKFGFSRSLRELTFVKEALKERCSMGAPLSDAKRILSKALTISEMDFVNELASETQRKMLMEIGEFGIPVERKLDDSIKGKDENEEVPTNSLRVASEKDSSVEQNGLLKKKKKLKRKMEDVKESFQTSAKKKKLRRGLQEEDESEMGTLKQKKKRKKKSFSENLILKTC
uniref:Nucleolus and neural progenitor protein-like N-terminal domain-containing protein n=1 Tax=Parascaris univalens TaxID=6257 RepID=A0A915B053_PARUN